MILENLNKKVQMVKWFEEQAKVNSDKMEKMVYEFENKQ